MNICSLVVHARAGMIGDVRRNLEALPGLEIHGGTDDGKLIVTVEDSGQTPASDTVMAINNVNGVLNASLIYHYGGEEPLEEEIIRENN